MNWFEYRPSTAPRRDRNNPKFVKTTKIPLISKKSSASSSPPKVTSVRKNKTSSTATVSSSPTLIGTARTKINGQITAITYTQADLDYQELCLSLYGSSSKSTVTPSYFGGGEEYLSPEHYTSLLGNGVHYTGSNTDDYSFLEDSSLFSPDSAYSPASDFASPSSSGDFYQATPSPSFSYYSSDSDNSQDSYFDITPRSTSLSNYQQFMESPFVLSSPPLYHSPTPQSQLQLQQAQSQPPMSTPTHSAPPLRQASRTVESEEEKSIRFYNEIMQRRSGSLSVWN